MVTATRGRGKTGKARTKRPEPAGPIDPRFAPVAAAFAKDRAVGLGKMFASSSVLNVNGKIFAMLARDRFVAKLPRPRVDALVAAGAGALFDPGHGRPMKEWIAIEGDQETWIGLAREARAFVGAAAAKRTSKGTSRKTSPKAKAR